MPKITINGTPCEFTAGQMILQVANAHGLEIPQYCYHDGLSIVASCRICLAECFAPNPKTGQLEPFMGGKLMPTCQTPASDGMVVYTDSPKSVQNQKAVMEYLLINHPLDCPVCDQSGECFLQDYSYQYGRSVSRFEEQKVKQPKKDLGPHVFLYSDRCIMCTRCVRFTREVTKTAELLVQGRGNKEEIDIFPGVPLDNELSANVVDLCPVGALLDKDFLFAQRVWFLKETPAIDPITASGDNIWIHHNEGKVYRIKPRTNLAINKWWITDEVRYGWNFVHSPDRLTTPMRRQYGVRVETDYARAYDETIDGLRAAATSGKRAALLVSPMLTCEEAFALASAVRSIDKNAVLAVGPVPTHGQDRTYPPGDPKGFKVSAEKAPNARGVRRVLESFGVKVLAYDEFLAALGKGSGKSDIGAALITGNYPSDWVTDDLVTALSGKFVALIDTLPTRLAETADIVLPGATFAEKAGTFENVSNTLQAFEQAIAPIGGAKSEGQIAIDLAAIIEGVTPGADETSELVVESSKGQVAAGTTVVRPVAGTFNAAGTRARMAQSPALAAFASVPLPAAEARREPDMEVVDL
jgi:NADH-quinone oxidoreductase subunit G